MTFAVELLRISLKKIESEGMILGDLRQLVGGDVCQLVCRQEVEIL